MDEPTDDTIRTGRQSLEALATTFQASVQEHGGAPTYAALAALWALSIRDLPPEQAEVMRQLGARIVAELDDHEAWRAKNWES